MRHKDRRAALEEYIFYASLSLASERCIRLDARAGRTSCSARPVRRK